MDTRAIHTYEQNGVRTITLPSLAADVVRVVLLADIRDPLFTKRQALGALYAELLTCGAGAMSRKKFAEKLDALGASLSTSWSDGTLSISLVCTREHLHAALRILKDMLLRPRFTDGEIERAQKKFAQDFHEEEDDARRQAYIGFVQALYPEGHTHYQATSLTMQKDVLALTEKDIRAAHTLFHTASWTVGISSAPAVYKTVRTLLEGARRGGDPGVSGEKHLMPAHAPLRVYKTVPGKTNIELFIGNTLPILSDDREYLALSLGVDILGKRGGFVGRLMSTVREKEGLTYSIYAWLTGATRRESGHFNIWTFFTARDFSKGITSTLRELAKIRARGVTDAELVRMKELTENQFSMAHGGSSTILRLYLTAFHNGFMPAEVIERMKTLGRIEKKEVNAALRAHIDPDALVISGAGPIREDGTPLEKV